MQALPGPAVGSPGGGWKGGYPQRAREMLRLEAEPLDFLILTALQRGPGPPRCLRAKQCLRRRAIKDRV